MRTVVILGVLVLILGVGCLNYTTAGGADHHREWAVQKGLPEPSPAIFYLGVACTVAGAGSVGFALGGRGRNG
jgi:hypothetical protein